MTFAGDIVRATIAKTDATGSYTIDNVAEGSYMLTTSSTDFQSVCYPDTSEQRCSPIELSPGEKRANVDLSLTPNAIARGRVVYEGGSPIANATVALTSGQNPSREIRPPRFMSGRPVQTAAGGTFELRGVAPGTWQLEARIPGAKDSMGLPVIFYPGVFQYDEATPIEVRAGEVTDNLVVVVPAITGNALNVHVTPGPVPIDDVRAALTLITPRIVRGIGLDADGAATITGLLPGRYFVAARGWIKDRAWAAFEIADFLPPSLDLSLQMKPAGSISGKIVAQNGGLPPLDGIVVAAGWTYDDVEINPMTPDQVLVAADGSFTIEGLFGQRTVRLIGLSPEWRVHAIRQGRSDINGAVDVPLDTNVNLTIVLGRR